MLQEILTAITVLALTLWVGGMFGVMLLTPLLFQNLESREQAGTIAGKMIARIQGLGGPLGALVLIATVLRFSTAVNDSNLGWLRIAALVLVGLMLALSLANSMLVQTRMAAIKEEVGGPIDSLSREHPLRARYNRIHGLSMAIFATVMVMGLAAVVVTAIG